MNTARKIYYTKEPDAHSIRVSSIRAYQKREQRRKLMMIQKLIAAMLIILSIAALVLTKELGFVISGFIGATLLIENNVVLRL